MTTYIAQDGWRFEASRSREVVDAMRAESQTRAETRERWMREVAERVCSTTGQKVRANNDVNFVRDLIAVGFLRKE